MVDQAASVKLNSAGLIANYFIDSKLTPIFILFCLIVGVLAGALTPREENPQITVPGAEIDFVLPGRPTEEVERLAVAPMERALREVDGVEHTFAVATHGAGQVAVQFKVGVDKEKAMVRVYQRVAAVQDRLPAGALPPRVRRVDVDDIPILTITLAAEDYDDYALRRMAERMAERLSTIESVSVTELHGGRPREIRIELDPARMEAYGLTLDQGLARLSASNVASLVGDQVSGNQRRLVNLRSELGSAEDVRRLALASYNGRLVYVDDVAQVFDGPTVTPTGLAHFGFGASDPRRSATHGEMSAVTLAVAKKPGTNAVTTAGEVLAAIETMRKQFVPATVHVVTTRNDGATANDTVKRISGDVLFATSAVILSLLPFLGLRAGLIICFELPLILFLTLGIDLLTGHTINRMSLFAFIIALGMIVDDGIVTLENIYRSYSQGMSADPRRQAVLAVNEIGPPTTMATIAVVLVFASLRILSGMNGEFFAPIAFNVQVTMVLSLIIAYMLVPWACHRWLRGHVPRAAKEDHESRLFRIYFGIITPLLERPRRRLALYALTLLALLLSLLQPAWQFIRPQGVGGPLSAGGVMLAIMPLENKNTLTVLLDLPEYTPLEVTNAAAQRFGAVLAQEPIVANYLSYVGIPAVVDFSGQIRGESNRYGPHLAQFTVNLVHKRERHTDSRTLVHRLREAAAVLSKDYPGLDVRVLSSPSGPPNRATVLAEIYGPDNALRSAAVAKVRERFEQTYGLVDVYDSNSDALPRVDLIVDREKAVLSGVAPLAIEQTLRALMQGLSVSEARIEGERAPVPIVLRVPRALEIDPMRLDRLHVANAENRRIPLSELVHAVPTEHDRPILRKNNERVSYVGADIDGTAPLYAIFDMDHHLDGLELAPGLQLRTGNLRPEHESPSTLDNYRLLWDGELRLTLEAFGEMSLVLSAALLFIYLLLVATYRSFVVPLIAMLAIPAGIIGVFPGHWLLGINFSMGSAIGVVALAGVVIRNSLLIIDFIRDYQHEGKSLEEAVRFAGAVRFRPIFLSALTVALGTLILYTDPLFAGLATSLIFGTLSSTVLTLLILPTLYYQIAVRHPEWVITDKTATHDVAV